jgi:alanine dehydrogenase
MTLFLGSDDIDSLAVHALVLEAARAAVRAQADGTTVLPARLDVGNPHGFLRVMPGAIDDTIGVKVMTLAEGLGTRYLLLVYRQEDGALEAVLDAERVTQLRTAAITLVAGNLLCPGGTSLLGLVGTGFEATGHLSMFASAWPLERVLVYSRSPERRRAFAERMSEELGVVVETTEQVRDVCASIDVVVVATKSNEPVVSGRDFLPGAVVLSIGSTRPDLRELDRHTLARSRVLVVDDVDQVLRESGDIIDAVAAGAIERTRIVDLGQAASLPTVPDGDGGDARDLATFKSVGTVIQDLALARALVAAAQEKGCGRELGELAGVKPFAERVAT